MKPRHQVDHLALAVADRPDDCRSAARVTPVDAISSRGDSCSRDFHAAPPARRAASRPVRISMGTWSGTGWASLSCEQRSVELQSVEFVSFPCCCVAAGAVDTGGRFFCPIMSRPPSARPSKPEPRTKTMRRRCQRFAVSLEICRPSPVSIASSCSTR